jgi:copper(I)-binding protein
MPLRASLVLGLVLTASMPSSAVDAQRTVRVSSGWITATASSDAVAGAVIENGTMYDLYLVAAESDVAATVELMQSAKGKVTVAKEVMVAAFDRLEMSETGTFLKLTGLKRPVKTGETIAVVLQTDGGERLTLDVTAK